jgi:DNA-binding CsgD family transcriptional regulator
MTGIVGRSVELARIEEFLGRHEDDGRALVLEGEPGIGKTTLWRWAAERAESQGVRVLRAHPAETERALSFATLGDLLSGVHEEIGKLPEPQRHALRVALLLEEPAGRRLDERVVGTAFASLLREVAREGGALVAIDDAQWADPSSWACIRFALRRLDAGVAALLTCRSDFDVDPGLARLAIGGLGDDAIYELVSRAGDGVLDGDDVRRIADLAAGHPLYALEIVRDSVARWREDDGSERAVGVPPALADAVLARVDGLPHATKRELLRLSAGGDGTDLLDGSLARAVETGLIERRGDAVRYVHPVFASAVYEAATPTERRAIHSELAATSRDIESRARHLAAAATGPDEHVASALDDAVLRARERGAVGAAAELAAAALRASPPESSKHWGRLVESATRQYGVGNLRAARELLEQALGETPRGLRRAEILLLLGDVLKDSVHSDRALACFREALEHAGDDARLRASLHANIAYVLQFSVGPAAAEADARRALDLAEVAGDDALLAQCLAALARIEFWLGRGVQREAMERAVELERAGADLRLDPRPSLLLAGQLATAGHLDEAREHLTRLVTDLRELGEPVHAILHRLSLLEHVAGNWSGAERLARAALDEARYAGERGWERFGLHALATVRAFRGDVEDARDSIERCMQIAVETGQATFVVGCRELLGFIALSLGDPIEAERQLAPAHAAMREMGIDEPRRYHFLPDEIEALVQLGRLDEAARWTAWLGERGTALDRAWAIAAAARGQGLLLGAGGLDADTEFDAALREHERIALPFERARTLLAYGGYLRRRRRNAAAREVLDEASAVFERLGARLWLARAGDELARLGGRAHAPTTLTPTERKIAARVASGRSNAEVANELFVSPKTIEWNLSKIYRKLGVRSRAELAAKLARQQP